MPATGRSASHASGSATSMVSSNTGSARRQNASASRSATKTPPPAPAPALTPAFAPSSVRPASRRNAKARASAPVARAAAPSESTKASSSPRTTSTRSESASSKPPSAGTNRSVNAGTSPVTTQRSSPLSCFSSPSLVPGAAALRLATDGGASHPPNVNSAPSPMAPSMPANSASRRRTSRLPETARNVEPPNRRSSGNTSTSVRATAREGPSKASSLCAKASFFP